MTLRLALVSLAALAACDGDPIATERAPETTPVDAAVVDGASGDATELPAHATRQVDACASTGSGALPCSYELALDPDRCAGAGCDKLVIFFAGGGQTCSPAIAAAYVAAGYVSSCVLLFADSEAAGEFPYNDEAGRVAVSVAAIVNDPIVTAAWSGERLLFSGTSHGATAPVIAMARGTADESAMWRGTAQTGACFMDGIYDIGALDQMLGAGNDGAPCPEPPGSVLSHARAIGRYYGSDPAGHSCANNKCQCDGNHSAELDRDSIVAVSTSRFAIRHWKLIECGSALDACTGDVVPGAPIEKLCTRLDADPIRDCTFASMPNVNHVACAPASVCIDWFDRL